MRRGDKSTRREECEERRNSSRRGDNLRGEDTTSTRRGDNIVLGEETICEARIQKYEERRQYSRRGDNLRGEDTTSASGGSRI